GSAEVHGTARRPITRDRHRSERFEHARTPPTIAEAAVHAQGGRELSTRLEQLTALERNAPDLVERPCDAFVEARRHRFCECAAEDLARCSIALVMKDR